MKTTTPTPKRDLRAVRDLRGIEVRKTRDGATLVSYDPALYTSRQARSWERRSRP